MTRGGRNGVIVRSCSKEWALLLWEIQLHKQTFWLTAQFHPSSRSAAKRIKRVPKPPDKGGDTSVHRISSS